MTKKITTYTLDHPGSDALSAELDALGSFTDEDAAREALDNHMGWVEVVYTGLYQISPDTAAFSAYPSQATLESDVTRSSAPRILQRNVEVGD